MAPFLQVNIATIQCGKVSVHASDIDVELASVCFRYEYIIHDEGNRNNIGVLSNGSE